MKIASWNVNSIRARKDRVIAWLESRSPDVVCLQETKVTDAIFPRDDIESLGYRIVHHGQQSYNGVAILSRSPIEDVRCGFGDGGDDDQARCIAGTIDGVRVISAYVPNGRAIGSDKYVYKLEWLARLRAYLGTTASPDDELVLCGDFNVAPDDRDVHDPAAWEGEVHCSQPERDALQRVVDWGLRDTFRMHVTDAGFYSWWDYRMLGFPKNKGLRIDQIYATEPLAARCTEASIDREARKGKLPSDHAPVLAVFSD